MCVDSRLMNLVTVAQEEAHKAACLEAVTVGTGVLFLSPNGKVEHIPLKDYYKDEDDWNDDEPA